MHATHAPGPVDLKPIEAMTRAEFRRGVRAVAYGLALAWHRREYPGAPDAEAHRHAALRMGDFLGAAWDGFILLLAAAEARAEGRDG